ncbi:MAG: hypothetical protein K9J81_12450 [Desulfohalobiaceae bacterium]|nr:hypothetical protein [Desulfohalobiaceae bacterium]
MNAGAGAELCSYHPAPAARQETPAVEIGPDFQSLQIEPQLNILPDPGGTLTYRDVSSPISRGSKSSQRNSKEL